MSAATFYDGLDDSLYAQELGRLDPVHATLTRYTQHRQLESDNNFSERCLRPFACRTQSFTSISAQIG